MVDQLQVRRGLGPRFWRAPALAPQPTPQQLDWQPTHPAPKDTHEARAPGWRHARGTVQVRRGPATSFVTAWWRCPQDRKVLRACCRIRGCPPRARMVRHSHGRHRPPRDPGGSSHPPPAPGAAPATRPRPSAAGRQNRALPPLAWHWGPLCRHRRSATPAAPGAPCARPPRPPRHCCQRGGRHSGPVRGRRPTGPSHGVAPGARRATARTAYRACGSIRRTSAWNPPGILRVGTPRMPEGLWCLPPLPTPIRG